MIGRSDPPIWQILFERSAASGRSLQDRIRETVLAIIAGKHIPVTAPLPSSRDLAKQLGVARNTVALAYQKLVADGFLVSRRRSGYFMREEAAGLRAGVAVATSNFPPVEWDRLLAVRPSLQRNIVKPRGWLRYPYPFLYGQIDPALFPVADWRECSRKALSVLDVRDWTQDLIDGDDPLLIEQIRTRLLPRRGVMADESEIMVTLGAQQALSLLAELLVGRDTEVGIENPGYPDARNIFSIKTSRLRLLTVDEHGLMPGEAFANCAVVYLTPGHQCPTTAVMPLDRREALLAGAQRTGAVLIEDDYESEIPSGSDTARALKSFDNGERVVYVGSLSKILAPGLRLGYIVGSPALIREARALRRLMVRHPPTNNQRAAALFLSLGHYDALVRRLGKALKERSEIAAHALARHLPDFDVRGAGRGSSFWVTCPRQTDTRVLSEMAREQGVLIEPGEIFFGDARPPRNFLRLAFASIGTERIEPGIKTLAAAARSYENGAPQ